MTVYSKHMAFLAKQYFNKLRKDTITRYPKVNSLFNSFSKNAHIGGKAEIEYLRSLVKELKSKPVAEQTEILLACSEFSAIFMKDIYDKKSFWKSFNSNQTAFYGYCCTVVERGLELDLSLKESELVQFIQNANDLIRDDDYASLASVLLKQVKDNIGSMTPSNDLKDALVRLNIPITHWLESLELSPNSFKKRRDNILKLQSDLQEILTEHFK